MFSPKKTYIFYQKNMFSQKRIHQKYVFTKNRFQKNKTL